MRRFAIALGLATLVVGLLAGSASGAGTKKLVEGTVYDTTCASACVPECPPPPHCGPITQDKTANVVCAQQRRMIVCPLYDRTVVCVQAPCPGATTYPVYSGEGAIVKVRRRGSATVLATLPVVEGHFKIRLGAGEYVFHPYLGEEPCWSGVPMMQKVTPRMDSPVLVLIDVSNGCVAHPDATK